VLATITIKDILELLGIIVVVHAVLLSPLMLALAGVWREYVQNQERKRGT
jgi:membrane protein implicated in regulation of membrane protease activity